MHHDLNNRNLHGPIIPVAVHGGSLSATGQAGEVRHISRVPRESRAVAVLYGSVAQLVPHAAANLHEGVERPLYPLRTCVLRSDTRNSLPGTALMQSNLQGQPCETGRPLARAVRIARMVGAGKPATALSYTLNGTQAVLPDEPKQARESWRGGGREAAHGSGPLPERQPLCSPVRTGSWVGEVAGLAGESSRHRGAGCKRMLFPAFDKDKGKMPLVPKHVAPVESSLFPCRVDNFHPVHYFLKLFQTFGGACMPSANLTGGGCHRSRFVVVALLHFSSDGPRSTNLGEPLCP